MGQRENLWGSFRPPEGVTITITEKVPGGRQGVSVEFRIRHHKPEPDTYAIAELDQYAREGLQGLVGHSIHVYGMHGAAQALLAFERGTIRLMEEYCP